MPAPLGYVLGKKEHFFSCQGPWATNIGLFFVKNIRIACQWPSHVALLP